MDRLTDNHSSILKDIREDQEQKGWWEINNKLREETGIPPRPPSQSEGKRRSEIRKLLHGKMLEMLKNGSDNKTKTKFYMDNKRNPRPGSRAEYMEKCNRMETKYHLQSQDQDAKNKSQLQKHVPRDNVQTVQ